MTSSFASAVTTDGFPSDYSVPSVSVRLDSEQATGEVSPVLRDALTPEAREAAISLAGDLVVRHMHMAQEDSANYFLHRGNGDRARLSMEALERGRSCGGSGNGE
jgi:hypothetical protein